MFSGADTKSAGFKKESLDAALRLARLIDGHAQQTHQVVYMCSQRPDQDSVSYIQMNTRAGDSGRMRYYVFP